jgi:hypothetical protein
MPRLKSIATSKSRAALYGQAAENANRKRAGVASQGVLEGQLLTLDRHVECQPRMSLYPTHVVRQAVVSPGSCFRMSSNWLISTSPWGKWATMRSSPPMAATNRRSVLTYMSD